MKGPKCNLAISKSNICFTPFYTFIKTPHELFPKKGVGRAPSRIISKLNFRNKLRVIETIYTSLQITVY